MGKSFTVRILLVDDEPDFLAGLSLVLQGEGYPVHTAPSGEEALELMRRQDFDLVVTDMIMPGMKGMELLARIRERHSPTEVIMATGYGSIDNAVEAMKAGAFGYFVKGGNVETLLMEIQKLNRVRVLKQENDYLKEQLETDGYTLETRSPAFAETMAILDKAADSNANILLMGESGVGKEILARYIHAASERRNAPFIAVNCQALGESVLESELFGHEKGAFTGANSRRIGRFEAAHGGTFFLDELGETTPATQMKLLRVLESKTIERLGSNHPIHVDLRLVCATNKDLYREVRERRFREDLLFRINTIVVEVPPLRRRREDLPILIDFFFRKYGAEQKKKLVEVRPEVMGFLLKYDYPGNIRELKNIVERLMVLSSDGMVGPEGLPKPMFGRDGDASPASGTLREVRKASERRHIRNILDKSHNNHTKAAEILGITPRQLYNKIQEYGIGSE